MADEARVHSSLRIVKRNGSLVVIDYTSPGPGAYTVTVGGTKGPSPGALTIPTGGKVVDFSELTDPGLCVLKNQDATNYVRYGVWDPDTDVAYLPFRLDPGQVVVLTLDSSITEQWEGTGTGTGGPGGYRFFMKANAADVVCSIEAFER